MENLAPPAEFMIDLRFSLEKGLAVRQAAQLAAQKASDFKWRQTLMLWLSFIEMGRPTDKLKGELSLARQQCLNLIERGFRGESIHSQVCILEEEFLEAAQLEMEQYVARLPMKAMIPLLFFQFPSFMLLLLGPFLLQFLSQS